MQTTKLKAHASIGISSSHELSEILQWARALDESVDDDDLLSRFASIMFQATAAEKVALLLHDVDHGFKVRVFATKESTQLLNQPLNQNTQLPTQLIEHANNTANTVKVGTHNESPVADSYLSANTLASALCLPVMIRKKLAAVLYLEHSTKEDIFEHDCISVLNFLCYHAVNYLNTSALSTEFKQRLEPEEQRAKNKVPLPRLVIESVPAMIYHHIYEPDGSTFYTAFVNSKCKEMYGIDEKAAVNNGQALRKWVHPDDIQQLEQKVLVSVKQLEPYVAEYRVKLPGQSVRWHQSTGHPTRLESGHVSMAGVSRDITDQKTAELALLETQRQLQTVTENVPGMIYTYALSADGNHEITYASSRCLDLFEVVPDEALGPVDNLFGCMHEEDLNTFLTSVEESARQLTRLQIEYRVILPRQGLRWRQSIAHPRKDTDGTTVWDGVAIDITRHKLAESKLHFVNKQLAEATRMKDEFLANMSHELRTPLTAILSTGEVMKSGIYGPVTNEQLDGFKVIQDSGSHLLELINEVLDLAKIESGSVELEFSEIQIDQLCEASLQLVMEQAKQKNIELNLQHLHKLPPLRADEKRVRQILVNLLSNAVKFTPDSGKVNLEVNYIDTNGLPNSPDNSDGSVRFTVTDTGIGIDDSRLESLFDPFVQIDTSLNREHDGTGLGLSLVKLFAELHGGGVGVRSEVGKGSCFFIDLPLNTNQKVKDTTVSATSTTSLSTKQVIRQRTNSRTTI